ncbi:MAG TPA: lipoprotein signal peptidase [Ferruginibacter sp.]|nr:lipoprotein signal peptidase [Ferruginibacter sp.]HRO16971.1 lipoprotein signal peptidase [Ferruginibacter sp.]HRQ20736.1 lipoprotein signal peptidase [Ferruginibacter sp.]
MKKQHIVIIVLMILLVDQALKLYIKTTFHLHDSVKVLGSWFQLYFVENPGMAYGWKFGGEWGKVALTVFRIIAVIFGTWYIGKIIRDKRHKGFIICATLIYAGAIGNLIDSCFYGMIFDKGMIYDAAMGDYRTYNGLATFSSDGYSSFLHGNVVDMLHFPLIQGHFPNWFPIWGGEDFEFFRPIFNIADASISVGIITIFLYQKRFFPETARSTNGTVETKATVDDQSQVS